MGINIVLTGFILFATGVAIFNALGGKGLDIPVIVKAAAISAYFAGAALVIIGALVWVWT